MMLLSFNGLYFIAEILGTCIYLWGCQCKQKGIICLTGGTCTDDDDDDDDDDDNDGDVDDVADPLLTVPFFSLITGQRQSCLNSRNV